MKRNDELIAGVRIKGRFLGFETEFYMDSEKNVAAQIDLNKQGLTGFLDLFEKKTADTLWEYVNELGEFSLPILVWHDADGGWEIAVNEKDGKFRFILYSGKKGRLVLFDYKKAQICSLMPPDNDDSVIDRVMDFLGIDKLMFCYLQGLPNGQILERILKDRQLDIPEDIFEKDKDRLILYTKYNVDSMDTGIIKTLLTSSLFSASALEFYVEISSSGVRFVLMFPEVNTSIIRAKRLLMDITVGTLFNFRLSGIFSFPVLGNSCFEFNAEFTPLRVTLSASSVCDQVFRIPGTNIVLSNMMLSIGFAPPNIEFGIGAGVAIRDLSLFGAIQMAVSVGGGVPVVEMISVAMTEVSLSCLFENVLGLNDPAVKAFDVISVLPFTLDYNERLVPSKDVTKKMVADFINKSEISKVFPVSRDSIEVYMLTQALKVLDKQRMIHYNINAEGKLEFSPQFYYASRTIRMGAYVFQKGVFFCGELNILSAKFKTMFCALDGQGIIGFAKISGLDCGIIKLTASKRSSSTSNPVTTDSDSIVAKLVGSEPDNAAVFFLSLCRDKYVFYLDGHLELCGIFGVDTQIIFMEGIISIYACFIVGGMFSTTIDFAVQYASVLRSEFRFRFIFDAEPLYQKLDGLRDFVNKLAKRIKEQCSGAVEQLNKCEDQVRELNRQIDDLRYACSVSRDKIHKAKWWQFWIEIEEGAKIVGYEVAIAGVNAAIAVALGALELAKAAVKAASSIGEGVLKVVDLVITGMMKAFFIRYLEFGIEVKPSQLENGYAFNVVGKAKITVIGKDIEGEFNVDAQKVLSDAKSIIEGALEGLIKRVFPDNDLLCDCPEGTGYDPNVLMSREDLLPGHLYIPYNGLESLADIVGLAKEGVGHLEKNGQMVMNIEREYIGRMGEERAEFVDMLHSCKSNADAGESFIGRCTDEVYDSVRELARFLTERITDLKAGNPASNDEELAEVEKELQRYRDYTEPAMVNVEEIRNRFKDVACSIDPEEGKELLRKARMEKNIAPGESEGLRTMEERDYEGLYNAMEQIVEENFPKGEESHFFHFGNEYSFYDSLNNSREESGCAHVGPESHADLMRKVKEKGGFAPNYIPRL